jgi:hypothetical protein
MTKNNTEIQLNCFLIETMVRSLVINGITDNKKIVDVIDAKFHPENEWEMEMYSEAIIYAKQAVLN